MNYDNTRLGLRVLITITGAITVFIAAIWLLAAYAHGPYHPNLGPKQVCLHAHDVYHYDDQYSEYNTKTVCDDYGQVYPGTTPTPDPSETSVVTP